MEFRQSGLEDGAVLTAVVLPPVYGALGHAGISAPDEASWVSGHNFHFGRLVLKARWPSSAHQINVIYQSNFSSYFCLFPHELSR